AELRRAHGVGEAARDPRRDPETRGPRRFLAALEQQLHAEADAERRAARGDALAQHRGESEPRECRGPGAERADARHDDRPGARDVAGALGEARCATGARESAPPRREVGDAGRHDDDGQRVAAHRTPLVLGTSSNGSRATAARSASAVALNAASARWWSFSPFNTSTCSAARAAIASERST